MLSDTDKINVLMIYYQHWGKEEINARKTVQGLNMTIKALEKLRTNKEETLRNEIIRYFNYIGDDDLNFMWSEFAELFLQDEVSPFYMDDDGYDEDDLIFDRRCALEDRLLVHNEETADMIFELNYQEILSVDAIIALV